MTKPCLVCGEPSDRSRCPEHQNHKSSAGRHAVHLNTTRWKKLSRKLRRMQPFCSTCGAREDLTVDHIVPVSKGGKSTFGNQVAACKSCNGFKANRTPRQAGMAMRHAPFVYDPWAQDQKEVWELFTLLPETG